MLADAGQVPLESRDTVRVRDVMQPLGILPSADSTASAWQVVRLLQDGADAVVVLGGAEAESGAVVAADLDSFLADRFGRPQERRLRWAS